MQYGVLLYEIGFTFILYIYYLFIIFIYRCIVSIQIF